MGGWPAGLVPVLVAFGFLYSNSAGNEKIIIKRKTKKDGLKTNGLK